MTPPVTLFSFNINDFGDQFDRALERLPATEHEAVLRYKFKKDRRLSLGGRLLRRYYFSRALKLDGQSIDFVIQPDGKPALVHPQGIVVDFNISHDGDWVIFGVTEQPGMSIGVDVVAMNHDTYGPISDFISSFNDQLMEEERQLLGSIKDDRHRLTTFYQIWGLKESYIKAIGKGLALDLDQFCILPSPPNSVGSPSTKVRRLGLRARRANGDDDDQVGNWCIHLDYLDSKSISVVCCGSRKGGSILDKDLVELGGTTMNLGDMYNGQPSIFTRLDLTTLLS